MSDDSELDAWGWDAGWAAEFGRHAPEGSRPARVSGQERTRWTLQTAAGPVSAVIPRRISGALPVVGDWVAVTAPEEPGDDWHIATTLPYRSKFSRRAAGQRNEEQVVATNVDRVWILHGLDRPPNPRSLERYLAAGWESGAEPEIVLSKTDVAVNLEQAREVVESIAFGVPIWETSTKDDAGVDEIAASLRPGETVALLGPSGVGKSSLVNRIAGESLLAEGEVRESDRKGRHTTTRRLLVRLPGGSLLLDTPGMRSLPLWNVAGGLGAAFPEIASAAVECRFRNCRHGKEPGCAVRKAVDDGRIDADRLEGYLKLLGEASSA